MFCSLYQIYYCQCCNLSFMFIWNSQNHFNFSPPYRTGHNVELMSTFSTYSPIYSHLAIINPSLSILPHQILIASSSLFVWCGVALRIQCVPLTSSGSSHYCLSYTGVVNQNRASRSPTEPTPAAPPPLITHDEQPSSTNLSLKSQWTPLPLPLASAEWISSSAGLTPFRQGSSSEPDSIPLG